MMWNAEGQGARSSGGAGASLREGGAFVLGFFSKKKTPGGAGIGGHSPETAKRPPPNF